MILSADDNFLSGVVNDYEVLCKIEEGVYGKVYKVCRVGTDQIFAVKVIKSPQSEEGVPHYTLREIFILRDLTHENVLKLYDVIQTKEKMLLIFEYMDTDLNKYIKSSELKEIPLEIVKDILKQILNGLFFLKLNDILHRDLAPKNILLNLKNGNLQVKLADFGLARKDSLRLTKEVVTPLYRAPELFFDFTKSYTSSIDIWSLGCIFAELLTKTPLFLANSEKEVFFKILSMYGIENFTKGSINYEKVDCNIKNLKNLCPSLDPSGLDLLQKMLHLDPSKRISAWEALNHEFFD